MGAQVSKQVERRKSLTTENKTLSDLKKTCGCDFPGCEYRPSDRKNWMDSLDPEKLVINKIAWPGTHNSATNKIGIPLISRPFAQCQTLSIYRQLCSGTRVFDIRVEEEQRVCHGVLRTYGVEVVPPDFDEYLIKELGDQLIHQDDHVFRKKVSELLPRRVICIWKPRNSSQPKKGSPLWNGGYLKDNWIDTDLPSTKFENNLKHLAEQPSVSSRKFFYRVENTVTPQADNPVMCVWPVTSRIHGFARLFITQCVSKGCIDRLQIFSTDFINEDFVDACVGLTYARIEGKA